VPARDGAASTLPTAKKARNVLAWADDLRGDVPFGADEAGVYHCLATLTREQKVANGCARIMEAR
jgi:hypothetical protein